MHSKTLLPKFWSDRRSDGQLHLFNALKIRCCFTNQLNLTSCIMLHLPDALKRTAALPARLLHRKPITNRNGRNYIKKDRIAQKL